MSALPEHIQKLVDEAQRYHEFTNGAEGGVSGMVKRLADALVDAYARPAEEELAAFVHSQLVHDCANGWGCRNIARAILARFPSVGRANETVSSACDSPCESQSTETGEREPSALTQATDSAQVLSMSGVRLQRDDLTLEVVLSDLDGYHTVEFYVVNAPDDRAIKFFGGDLTGRRSTYSFARRDVNGDWYDDPD